MPRLIRPFAVLLVLGATVTLALLPAGNMDQHRQGLIASFIGPGVALARRIISPPATAFNVNKPPELEAQGHQVVVHGLIDCAEGELFRIRVTVSQPATDDSDGALAEGYTHGVCTGEIQDVVVTARTRASTVFEQGDVRVCALATTRLHGPIDDVFQWCRDFDDIQ